MCDNMRQLVTGKVLCVCAAKAEAAHAGITAEAYHFLAGQGCINFGLLQNEPDPGEIYCQDVLSTTLLEPCCMHCIQGQS